MDAPPELAGQQASCPQCGAEFFVPAAPANMPAPPRPNPGNVRPKDARGFAGKSMRGPQQATPRKARKSFLKRVLLFGGGLLPVIAAIIGWFWYQDHRLQQHGVSQIEAMHLAGNEKLMYLAMADHHHNEAANSGTRITKRSTGTPGKEQYWSVLKSLIDDDLRKMPAAPNYEAVAGKTWLWKEGHAHYLMQLNKDGTYVKTKYWDVDHSYSKPKDTAKGKWSASAGQFHWTPDGESPSTQEIIRMGAGGFVLKSGADAADFWRFYN